jgi:hypothetical protein
MSERRQRLGNKLPEVLTGESTQPFPYNQLTHQAIKSSFAVVNLEPEDALNDHERNRLKRIVLTLIESWFPQGWGEVEQTLLERLEFFEQYIDSRNPSTNVLENLDTANSAVVKDIKIIIEWTRIGKGDNNELLRILKAVGEGSVIFDVRVWGEIQNRLS